MEEWNGTEWKLQTIASPNGSTENRLEAVSCTSSSSCEAVGIYYKNFPVRLSLAEHWNGTEWSTQGLPESISPTKTLSGISCTASTACMATGSFEPPGYFPYEALEANLVYNLSGTTWSLESMTQGTTGSTAVSCSSSTACTAVGSLEGEGEGPSEAWNGGVWSNWPLAKPAGAAGFTATGVSCTAPGSCTAVGSYTNSSGTRLTLGEQSTKSLHGRAPTWSVQSTPNPTGAKASSLKAVSCTATTACTAVGVYTNSSGTEVTLAERWNGTEWAIQTTPNPTGAKASSLKAVSCTASTECKAVGTYTNSSGVEVTLAERWKGTEWTIQTTPNPTGAKASALAGISCTLSSACTAVGYDTNGSGVEVTLAERWNGTEWSLQSTATPTGATASSLRGVSCQSATACTAVGKYDTGSAVLTVVEGWNGTEWQIQWSPNPGGSSEDALAGVSCTTSSFCMATGSTAKSTLTTNLAEVISGPYSEKWFTQPTPNPSGAKSSYTDRVSCTSPSACTAVGWYQSNSGAYFALAERWNGTEWAIQETPEPKGTLNGLLDGVSCTSATSCTAVGYYEASSGTTVTLAESWNGSAWSVQTTPNPTGVTESLLEDISCSSSTACTAVGWSTTSEGDYLNLAERWNGTEWTLQTVPAPAGALDSLLARVSCPSATACTVVGEYVNSEGDYLNLAEQWNGTEWKVQTVPNPVGVKEGKPYKFATLTGVSCTSSTACTAVGVYVNTAGTELPLAERWNGTEWLVQSISSPVEATRTDPATVSCASATACTTVGAYETSAGGEITLAEHWNGTEWKVQASPNPAGAKRSGLSGVSCLTATLCTAVGSYTNSAGTELTLAEIDD
jgi:hypothetical protein